jgi:hypothetical protein
MKLRYPLVIFDPHGDYLGLFEKRKLFPDSRIRILFPVIRVKNRDASDRYASKTDSFRERDREFESPFLQRRVICEPYFLDQGADRAAHRMATTPHADARRTVAEAIDCAAPVVLSSGRELGHSLFEGIDYATERILQGRSRYPSEINRGWEKHRTQGRPSASRRGCATAAPRSAFIWHRSLRAGRRR